MNSTLPHALQSNFPSVKSYGLTNMIFTSRSKPLLRQLTPCLMTFLVWVKEYVQILSNVTGAISEVKLLLYILEKNRYLKTTTHIHRSNMYYYVHANSGKKG